MKDEKVGRDGQNYSKPQLKVVELVGDEVLAAFCKNDSTNGPFQANCRTLLGQPCVQLGGGVS